ncbi:hypothetical protein Tco_0956063 [Tanacetum coccineum]|uniref:Gag-Pol polyprotein n=1 Tax=Tanacetum coccineum TaxID=301880 RepID=A0ABQ5E947_9ASTR
MSNTNTNLQIQTSNALYNAIMEVGGKDRPPMLAPDGEGNSETTTEWYMENYKNVSQDIRDQLNVEAEAVQIDLTWMIMISTSQLMLVQMHVKCGKLLKEWQRFVTLVKQSQELKIVSYHKLYDILKQHQNKVNEIRTERLARIANPLTLIAQQQSVYHPQNHPNHYTQNYSNKSQQAATRNRGKAIFNSPLPTYNQEPEMVTEDDALLKEKEINKLMALNNTPRINRGTGYDNQRAVNVVGAKDYVGNVKTQKGQRMQLITRRRCYCIQEVTPDAADNSRPIFDTESLKKVQNDDDNYNVFANDREHPEQPESVNHTYLEEQGDTNITTDSLDMSTNRETIDQDDDDLARERDLLASLIDKLKCEIDDNKNRNKLLESSNKTLVDKLKGEIENFKTKNKSLESSNNHFKEANNELSNTNQLMFKDLKKF